MTISLCRVRRTLRVALAALAVVVAAGALVQWPRSSLITQEHCGRIRAGMRRTEVEAILGVPPGDYRTGATDSDFSEGHIRDMESSYRTIGMTLQRWQNDAVICLVVFDRKDRVFLEIHNSDHRQAMGVLDTVCWRVKRQWHRWFP
jgi:hypothetical protein